MDHQHYIKQGFDPEQAKILVMMQPAIDAELARIPEPTARALSSGDRGLLDLVEKYEARWPQIIYVGNKGSRARRAMEAVLSGQIHRLPDQDGNDLWLVRGHRCSKAAGWCDCEDRVYCDPIYGKLCQHRLAVALKSNWLGDRHEAFLGYLRSVIEQAGDVPYLDILIQRDYDYHHEGDAARVAGHWRIGTNQAERLPSAGVMPVTVTQFKWALEQLGWGLVDLPLKAPGFQDYYYRIAAGEGLPIDDTIFYKKGRTWAMEDRERMRRFRLADLAASLEFWLNGPIRIDLSRYEAKRVTELRQRMKTESLQAAEVWQNLPDILKNSILDQEGVQYAN